MLLEYAWLREINVSFEYLGLILCAEFNIMKSCSGFLMKRWVSLCYSLFPGKALLHGKKKYLQSPCALPLSKDSTELAKQTSFLMACKLHFSLTHVNHLKPYRLFNLGGGGQDQRKRLSKKYWYLSTAEYWNGNVYAMVIYSHMQTGWGKGRVFNFTFYLFCM